jgi:alkylation response protein AidB-like acyl-CoA dehydrogenase
MEYSILTPEERTIRDAARRLAKSEIAPRSAAYDETGAFPRENLKLLAEQGYFGLTVPPEYGGAGASSVAQALVVEALAEVCPATAVIYEVHNTLHVEGIWRYGTEWQRRTWLPALLRGEWIGAFALTEPGAGSNAAEVRTVGRRVPGGYRISGHKVFITSAGEAERYLVVGRLEGTSGRDGMTIWLVDKSNPGVTFGRAERKLGLHASRTSEIRLDDVFVPETHRLGAEGEGYRIALDLLDGGRIGIAAQACGMLAAALARSARYARVRRQFGQPLERFEAIRFKLADMVRDLHAARLLTYEAARRRDEGGSVRPLAAAAKLFASEAAVRHALQAVQIHGGYGYIREAGVERLLRDAKATEIYEGTSEIMRLILAGEVVRAEAEGQLEG